jgi:hypothetical protein
MIKGIRVNGYFYKGKLHDINSGAIDGDNNTVLEKHESVLAELIGSLVKAEFKPEKKGVYFITFEGDYLESGRLKNQTEFTCTKMDYNTPGEFIRHDKQLKKQDIRELAKVVRDDL